MSLQQTASDYVKQGDNAFAECDKITDPNKNKACLHAAFSKFGIGGKRWPGRSQKRLRRKSRRKSKRKSTKKKRRRKRKRTKKKRRRRRR